VAKMNIVIIILSLATYFDREFQQFDGQKCFLAWTSGEKKSTWRFLQVLVYWRGEYHVHQTFLKKETYSTFDLCGWHDFSIGM